MAFDLTQIITYASLGVGILVGVMTVRQTIIKGREESQRKITELVKTEGFGIKDHIDNRLKVVDSKFDAVDVKIAKDQDDIKDIEVDMKQMVSEFKNMCEKLSKHDFIIDTITPEFKGLQKEFYRFKHAVDTNLRTGFTGINNTNDNINNPESENSH